MAVQSPPFALQNSSAHSAALFRQAASANLYAAGVLGSGELAVAAQGTPNMSVTVAAGRAWIPGSQVSPPAGMGFTTQATYFALNDATATVTVATADPTNPRIDAVYIAVQDSFYSGAANTAVLGVVTGTPAPTPTAPAVPNNALALANIAVAANATSIVSGNIASARAGSITTPQAFTCLSTAHPTGVWPGFEIFETDTGLVKIWSGTGWKLVGPPTLLGTSGAIAGSNMPAGTIPLIQAGTVTVTTNGSAIGVFNWPAAFPNGLQSVVLTTLTDTVTQLRLVASGGTTLTACQFVARTPAGAAATSTALTVSYVAIGW